jgi:hypothetical protein
MARFVYLAVLVLALLVLALGGWTVKGLKRMAAAGPRRPRPAASPRVAAA